MPLMTSLCAWYVSSGDRHGSSPSVSSDWVTSHTSTLPLCDPDSKCCPILKTYKTALTSNSSKIQSPSLHHSAIMPCITSRHTSTFPAIQLHVTQHRRQCVVVDGEVSNWKSVLSGVPQGSVLFLIYINDLDDNITSNILKFADDTKVFRKVNTDGDKQHLQNDLDRLVK